MDAQCFEKALMYKPIASYWYATWQLKKEKRRNGSNHMSELIPVGEYNMSSTSQKGHIRTEKGIAKNNV